jgi:uncharacterized cupin superfamily protein
MKPYLHQSSQENLEMLPPLSDSAGYTVIEGNPRASMRLDSGSIQSRHRLGIWMCTPGTFSCTEKGDELQTIIEGRLSLTYADGRCHNFGPGDSIYTEKAEQVTWKIFETVKKVFFTHDQAGVEE